ncbi:hypothetical protein LTS07_008791 [Exophiala sideris]|uniref:Uncharacterized protein n=1 Tax=Exophiala sideris TaxID=1016849 RepID=A0ABR0J226_9EURO|nr:hypothetical protein LTS07_008791 [Exophiala sideris]KAK5029082.1 hypothetical protein LTR13_008953 [Exophiala sideris]KAK5054769.1 hypothetical protein LTR69_008676 [Exophiala sideris]KAK5178905.1 hypothetical protein LTR44_008734 [Eurotiomycetes sp. CCFEE 6388]
MSTFVEGLEELSLGDSSMEFPGTLEERKPVVRDILASFVRDSFASEYKIDVYDRIDDNQANRDFKTRVIHDDFVGTMMQAGCFDRKVWEVLNKCHPPDVRARIFLEKLQQRFAAGFERYQSLTTAAPLAHQVQNTVMKIATSFRRTAEAARRDLQQRTEGRTATVLCLLKVLEKVCEHGQDIAAIPHSSLFFHLILGAPTTESAFLLDALEIVEDGSITIPGAELRNIRDKLVAISGGLPNTVPVVYRNRVGELTGAVHARLAGPA